MNDELNPAPQGSRLDKKYRLIVINDESFEEVASYKLTELNVYLFISGVLVAVVLFVLLLFVLTPLKNIIPGFGDVNALSNRKEIVKIYKHIDSLEDVVNAQALYITSVGKALRGEHDVKDLAVPAIITDFGKANAGLAATLPDKSVATTSTDTKTEKTSEKALTDLDFFPPISKGIVTDAFNVQPGHFGIDIAAPKNTPIQAVAEGIVICATWTPDTGFIIGIQHANNLVSFYKHNAILYKKIGTTVQAGEAIATIGNTGDLSSGPHLHFELWHNGKPINPSDYIKF